MDKSPVDCFLDRYIDGLRNQLVFLREDTLPLVLIARGLRHYILNVYRWDEENVDIYLSKCSFVIAEEMSPEQVEKAIEAVKLLFDVQMEVFDQIGIGKQDLGIIAKYTAGIVFEMGVS